MTASGGIISQPPPRDQTDADRMEAMARAMAVADGYDPRDFDDEAWAAGWRHTNPTPQQLGSSTEYRNLARRFFHAAKALKSQAR